MYNSKEFLVGESPVLVIFVFLLQQNKHVITPSQDEEVLQKTQHNKTVSEPTGNDKFVIVSDKEFKRGRQFLKRHVMTSIEYLHLILECILVYFTWN